MSRNRPFIILVAALSLSLAACNEKNPANGPVAKAEAKVGVKVNGEAISVSELDLKSGHETAEKNHAISESKMKHLVDMELIRQAAVQSGLDAEENIRARIANSTRTILAMAYMDKQLASIGKPTDAEVTEFYNSNPARFAERKQYQIHEFSILPPAGKAPEIQAQLAKSRNAQAFDQWLTDNKIPHSSTPVSVTADQLPDDVLQKIKDVPVGGAAVMGGNEQMHVLFVLAEQKQPISLAEAKPGAAMILMEKRKTETLENMLKQLRDKAKIEYVTPYTAKGLPAPVEVGEGDTATPARE
jgi:EpsD family peptidyl-prolyl cis-trans isomerase